MPNSIGTFHHGCIKPGFTMGDYCIDKGTLFNNYDFDFKAWILFIRYLE